MNEIFEKIYNDNNTDLNESSALFEKVYTEAEMLNEMNPKLKALLAAGLIGTAGLGAVSCSMPTDDPTGYEQPALETPVPENPGDNGGDTEETVTFESLGVTPEHAARLAEADEFEDNLFQIPEYEDPDINYHSFIYKSNEDGFVRIEFKNSQYEDGSHYMSYINDKDDTNWYLYYIPVSMKPDFEAAIAAYNNAQ